MKFYLDLRSSNVDPSHLIKKYPISGIIVDEPSEGTDVEYQIKEADIIRNGIKVGKILNIENPQMMSDALGMEINQNLEFYLIRTKDWHIIPLENLIAKFNSSEVNLIAEAKTPEEIQLFHGILEKGISGCVLRDQEYSFDELLETVSQGEQALELVSLKIKSIEKMGSGDRVCVDTCAILRKGEGLLVGSTANVMILVQAEVEESGFVSSRPFRINAGVVASYVLNSTKTNYLSELQAGKSVMIVNREGQIRQERVARVKIERRPLVLIKVEFEDKLWPIILQDAETVKVVSNEGAIGVHELQVDDEVLAKISSKGRHFGMEVDEFLEEK